MAKKDTYDADSLVVLEFPDKVRKRPGMYIGGTTTEGMHHTYKEILDNSVDEAVANYCTKIIVTNEGNGFLSILDNGRGIPPGINKSQGVSGIELVFTVLHAGGKFDNDKAGAEYKTTGGLHGVGASVTNAVSEELEVFVKRGKKIWTQNFKRGIKINDVALTKNCDVEWDGDSGTFVKFKPDNKIFKHIDIEWEFDRIKKRCREIAFLVPGLEIVIQGFKGEDEADVTFKFDNGLQDYVAYQMKGKSYLVENIDLNIELPELGCSAQAVFTYETEYDEHLISFANNIPTHEGGVHLNAFLNALLKVIIDIGEREKITKGFAGKVNKSDIREGLNGVLSIRLQQPEFEGQTKTKLGNPEIRQPLEEQFYAALKKMFDKKRKEDGKEIANKILLAVMAREHARRAKDLTRKKGGLEHFTLKGKLADCESKDPEECELFLVEGDSAGGSAKQGRNNRFQAILPLRGKVINVEKSSMSKALKNKEFQSLITALNVSPKPNGQVSDIDDLRFHTIIILADADPDGAHIASLLITFFYKYMRTIIERGHLKVAQPPLFRVKHGKKVIYLHDDDEMEEYDRVHAGQSYEINRFKGLGEMNPEQLAETVMNPEARSLMQVNIDDATEAAEVIYQLFGPETELRRKWIDKDLNLSASTD